MLHIYVIFGDYFQASPMLSLHWDLSDMHIQGLYILCLLIIIERYQLLKAKLDGPVSITTITPFFLKYLENLANIKQFRETI